MRKKRTKQSTTDEISDELKSQFNDVGIRLNRKALEEGWQPNESDAERETNAVRSTFAEWYDLARSYGIVIGCREEDRVMMVQENTGNWYKFEEFSAKWTLEYLKRKQNRR